jgi:4-hydroxybenzoyl-CoA thioesterase
MLTYSRKVLVEFGDCDPAEIVYFPRYFTWFDNCTVALFAAAGITIEEMRAKYEVVSILMVDTRAKFMSSSRFGDELTIESCVREFRSSSFDVYHRVTNRAELAVEGFETRVWAGKHPDYPNRLKSRPIPEEVKKRFSL